MSLQKCLLRKNKTKSRHDGVQFSSQYLGGRGRTVFEINLVNRENSRLARATQ